jgi:WD40 repeat protein
MKEVSKRESGKGEDFGLNKSNICHKMEILDLLPIPDYPWIATASLDKNMCIWNMETLQGISIHTEHTKGIYSLDW